MGIEHLWFGKPDDTPEKQTAEEIQKAFRSAKTGDVAHLILQGSKKILYNKCGLPQVHGCVEEATEDSMRLWSTYFAFAPVIGESRENRTFTPGYVESIFVEPAEVVIPRATNGRHRYGSQADVETTDGMFRVTVDSWFNGLMCGLTEDGGVVTGGASYFHPA